MATLAQLKTRRDALQAALDSGVLSLREGDKQVTYRTAEEMARRLEALAREIAELEGTETTKGIYPQLNKGW